MGKTKYQKLIEKSDCMVLIAIEYHKLKENQLARFYKNASIGYKQKALNLNVRWTF